MYVCPENTHLLCKGKYNCMADLLFVWFGFNQTCKSLSNSTWAKQSNRRSAVHWYFPVRCKWVFSGLSHRTNVSERLHLGIWIKKCRIDNIETKNYIEIYLFTLRMKCFFRSTLGQRRLRQLATPSTPPRSRKSSQSRPQLNRFPTVFTQYCNHKSIGLFNIWQKYAIGQHFE